jgi:UDP-N-acetyl-D-mannosaminuronate dehydrogenase
MKKSIIGVIGVGEIGSAMYAILKTRFKVLKKDLKFDEIRNSKLEVLHVCIPYTNKFVDVITSEVKKTNPNLVIIHSTVAPGTTRRIFLKTKISVVHSPVMGTHPDLKRDILRFTKFIGPINKESALLAKTHLSSVKIKTMVLGSPEETELGKLLDTTYYAWNVIFNKMVSGLCKEYKVSFENVYTKFNAVYNDGYKSSKPHVTRPILRFQEGEIGGHCLIPNAEIIRASTNFQPADFILNYNNSLKRRR